MGVKGMRSADQQRLTPKLSEEDIALRFIEHFCDFDVYPEVPTSNGICDIVVKDQHIISSIEVKKNFNFEVLEQAIRNKTIAHYSFIAVPSFKKMSFKKQLCKDYGVGLYVLEGNYISLLVEAQFNRTASTPKLEEWMKRSTPGTKNDRYTPFKIMIEGIETRLKRKGGKAKFEDVFDIKFSTYSTLQSAKNTLYSHCRNGVVTSFSFDKEYLVLNK